MTAAILFDFNGVIIDDEPQHCDALIATLGEDGFALDRDTYYREYLGFDDRECFRFSFARMGRAADEPALVLDLAGLRPHFSEIVAAEDVGACKPDPAGYNFARAALRVAQGRCMVIEDSLPGLAAARAAGLRCVMLSTSHAADACAGAD